MAREKRLEIEAKRRREVEEADRRRRTKECRDQVTKPEKYLIELGDTHARLKNTFYSTLAGTRLGLNIIVI